MKILNLARTFFERFPRLSSWLIVIATTLRLDYLGRFFLASKCYEYSLWSSPLRLGKLRELSEVSFFTSDPIVTPSDPLGIQRTNPYDNLPSPYTTGRFLYIQSIKKVEDYKNLKGIERFTYNHIINELYRNIKNNIKHGAALETEFEKDIREEYIHHQMILNTPILMLWNLCSYLVRLNLIHLTERQRQIYKYSRDETLETLTDKLANFQMEKWKKDQDSILCFNEALIHRAWSHKIAVSIAPVIEGLTLLITEESPNRYDSVNQKLKEQVVHVIKKVEKCAQLQDIREQRERYTDLVIKMGRIVFSAPLGDIEPYKREAKKNGENKDFNEFFKERLDLLLEEVEKHGLEVIEHPETLGFPISSPSESSLHRMFDYVLRKGGHYRRVRRTFLDLLKEKPEVLTVYNNLSDTDFYSEPAIMIAEPDGSLLPIDPEVMKTIGEENLKGFEDYWGRDRTLIFIHKILIDAIIESREPYWLKEYEDIIDERWPDKKEPITMFMKELADRSQTIVDQEDCYTSKREMMTEWFDFYVDLYNDTLSNAYDHNLIEELRMLSILGYIQGHR